MFQQSSIHAYPQSLFNTKLQHQAPRLLAYGKLASLDPAHDAGMHMQVARESVKGNRLMQ